LATSKQNIDKNNHTIEHCILCGKTLHKGNIHEAMKFGFIIVQGRITTTNMYRLPTLQLYASISLYGLTTKTTNKNGTNIWLQAGQHTLVVC
jgi:hypothetical protein